MTNSLTFDTNFTAADDIPVQTDFGAALAGHPLVVGVWGVEEGVVLDGNGRGGSIANLKSGGLSLVQPVAARRGTLAFDPDLQRRVLRFTAAESTFYALTGYPFVPANPWTAIVITRPTFSDGVKMLVGSFEGGTNTSAIFQTGTPYTFRVLVGEQTALDQGRAGLNRVVGGSSGNRRAKLSVNDALTVAAANDASASPTGTTFQVSHAGAPFEGTVDRVILIAGDLFADANADLVKLVRDYLYDCCFGVV